MAATTILAGEAVLTFGTTDDATYGILQNITVTEESDKKQILNGVGDTVGLIYSDLRQKVSAEYTPLTGAVLTAVKPGSLITVDGNAIRVDTAALKTTAADVQTWTVEGYVYANVASGI